MLKKLCLAAALMGSLSLQANTISVNVPTITPAGPDFTWTYLIDFANSELRQGAHFTIVDFGPVVGTPVFAGPGLPGSWVYSAPATGPDVVSGIGYNDTATLNAVFVYQGATLDVIPNTSLPLSLTSTLGVRTDGAYGSLDWGINDGRMSIAIGPTDVPGGVPRVPEGGMVMSLLGLGLVAVEGLRRKLS